MVFIPESDHSRLENALRKAGVVLSIAVGSLALNACATAEPTPTESPTLVEVTPQPDDRYEGADFERPIPLAADLAPLDVMRPAEFREQPKDMQLRWAEWAGQYRDQFVQYYHSVSGLDADAPYTIDQNSDFFTLYHDFAVSQQIGANFGVDVSTASEVAFNGQLDRDMIEKYITAYLSDADLGAVYMQKVGVNGEAINVVSQARRGEYSIDDAIKATDLVQSPSFIIVDGKQIPGIKYSYTAPDGSYTAKGTIAAYTFVDNGKTITRAIAQSNQ